MGFRFSKSTISCVNEFGSRARQGVEILLGNKKRKLWISGRFGRGRVVARVRGLVLRRGFWIRLVGDVGRFLRVGFGIGGGPAETLDLAR